MATCVGLYSAPALVEDAPPGPAVLRAWWVSDVGGRGALSERTSTSSVLFEVIERAFRYIRFILGSDGMLYASVNPLRTAVSFRGQSSQIPSSLSPKRECGAKRVKKFRGFCLTARHLRTALFFFNIIHSSAAT